MASDFGGVSKSQVIINTQPIPQAKRYEILDPIDAVNTELRRRLWEGLLPIKIDLAMSDLNSLEPPRSLYVRPSDLDPYRLWRQEKTTFSIFLQRSSPFSIHMDQVTSSMPMMKCGSNTTMLA